MKEICTHLHVIYLLPKDIEVTKNKLRQRHLKTEVEMQRLSEIEQHYNRVTTDENLRNMFDYVLYNNYDEESEKNVIDLVRKLMKDEGI